MATIKNEIFILILTFVVVVVQSAQTASAQLFGLPNISATPLPVGSGARAIGQGGAFIAVADDATAASWNPGALIQLERPEFSIVGSYLATQQDFDPGSTPLELGNESVSRGDLNYVSAAYPFRIFRKNFVAALNYQQVYDFHMNLDFDRTMPLRAGSVTDRTNFESKGGVGALTPAISMLVIPKLSIGVAVNFYTDEFFGDYAWRKTLTQTGSGLLGTTPFTASGKFETTYKNFQAVNVTTGLLWDVWEKEDKLLTFGAVYDTPYTANVDRVTNGEYMISTMERPTKLPETREHFKEDYPMSFGVGLGFRYSDALSFSMDVTWTDWSVFKQRDENGNESRPMGGASTDTKIGDTYAVRSGTEYLIFRQKVIIPVRGGLFYDPRPSLDDPVDVYGFSVGSGITFKRFSIDAAYQFKWAHDVDGEDFGLPGTKFDFNDHMFLTSLIVYF